MLSIIIPTYNESETLPILVRQIFEITGYNKIQAEIIIVDDNSPDGTGELAYYLKKFFPKLKTLHRTERLGKTSAFYEGLAQAQGNLIGMIDAGLPYSPDIIPDLVFPLISGNIDLTIGSRFVPGAQTFGWNFITKSLTRMACLLCAPLTPVHDPLSSYFFIRKSILQKIPVSDDAPYLLLELLAQGSFRSMQEIACHYERQLQGKSTAPQKAFTFLRQIGKLYKVRIRR
ncbi:MAG TPA: glycosyltransferase [bacterium]|nr:glycosyltransferase [bacterium]